ncbi:MarR family transcriptional regulator, partial [Butyricicoccus sp. 1XD8-22]
SHMNEFEKETVLRSLQLLNDCMAKTSVCCTPLY